MNAAMNAAKWVALAYLLALVALSVLHHMQKPGPPRHAGTRAREHP